MINVVKIILKGNISVTIDASDKKITDPYTWHALRCRNNTFYARTKVIENGKAKFILMHRLIMGLSHNKGMVVDHRNRDTLDNRRENLRICSYSENSRNRKPKNIGYKGVCLNKRIKKGRRFFAYIIIHGKRILLGNHYTDVDAAKAYNQAAIKYHGEFASLNEIIE